MLKVENVTKAYAQGELEVQAVKEVSFQAALGDTLAIVGPSGSGKTTLLSLLAGLDRPTEGRIFFDESNMTTMSEEELTVLRSKSIGIVFQQFHLMPHLTALENVMLPLEIRNFKGAKDKAMEALESVKLGGRSHHLPRQLSGGECQRVAIARAFVGRPKLLLADEPSGSLDQKTGTEIMNLVLNMASEHQTTLILVTHDPALAARCSRQICLEDGRQV